jgi:hypothetical protein
MREVQSEDNREDEVDLHGILPSHILARAAAFPISSSPDTVDQRSSIHSLFRYLPTTEKAHELRSIYFKYAAWM